MIMEMIKEGIESRISQSKLSENGDNKEYKTFPLIIDNDILNTIQQLTQQYYTNNKTTSYLKKNVKIDCSKYIWKNVYPSKLLIDPTIFIDSNRLYINYPLIKLFINPDIYEQIIDYTVNHILILIEQYGSYEIHINIEGFTISAAERYSHFINMIFSKLFNKNYSAYLDKMYIYNPPSVIEYLKPIFRNIVNNKNIMDKVVIVESS